jgi:multiple sugar transport system permease protein
LSRLSPLNVFRSFTKAFGYVLLVACAFLWVSPFLWMLSMAFKTHREAARIPPTWIPEEFITDNFVQVFKTASFPLDRAFLNSCVVSAIVTLGVVLVASLAAFAYARLEFKGRDLLFGIILASLMVPGPVFLIPQYLLIWRLNLLDTYSSLILPELAGGFGVFLLRQFFMGIPRDLLDAGRIDGCSWFRIFFSIALPLSKPALVTLGMFTFLGAWNSFTWPLVVLESPRMMTLPVALSYFQGEFYSSYPLLMAGVSIATVPVLIIFTIGQKWIVEGITLSGLKG